MAHDASTAVQLQRGVEVPQLQAGGKACREQPFVARRQGALQPFLLAGHQVGVGALHFIPAPGGSQRQTLADVYRAVNLHSVRVAAPVQVAHDDARHALLYLLYSFTSFTSFSFISFTSRTPQLLIVHHRLLGEVSKVVFGVQLQRATPEGNVPGRVQPHVPGLLLARLLMEVKLATAGQQEVVLGEEVRRAVAFACRQTHSEQLRGGIAQVQARRDEPAPHVAVVGAQTSHQRQLLSVQRVLGVAACRGLPLLYLASVPLVGAHGFQRESRSSYVIFLVEGLLAVVVVQRRAHRQLVVLAQVRLVHQLGVERLLVVAVVRQSVSGILHVQRAVGHQGQVCLPFRAEDEGVLHVGFVALGLGADGVEGHHVRLVVVVTLFGVVQGNDPVFVSLHGVARLAARALVFQCRQAGVHQVVVGHQLPAVGQVVLLAAGHVEESVVVVVMVGKALLGMAQHDGRQLFGEVDVAAEVSLQARLAVGVEVGVELLGVVGLQVLNVNLAGDALVAVLHRRCTLRHLYALHPRARHVVERVGQGTAPQVGQLLGEHLHVGAAEAQQLDLLGARGSIAVAHVDRRIGGEALAQIAAGSLEQLLPANGHTVDRTAHPSGGGTGGDRHFLDRCLLVDAVSRHLCRRPYIYNKV